MAYKREQGEQKKANKPEQNNPNTVPEHEQTEPEQNSVKKPDISNPDTENNVTRTELGQIDFMREDLAKTDQTFYDRAMKDFGEPYYRFGGQKKEGVCAYCSKPFQTTLALNRYCGYEHYRVAHKAYVRPK